MRELDHSLLNELCYIISIRNKHQLVRQCARSKMNYYKNILYNLRVNKNNPDIKIPKKYQKNSIGKLKIKFKEYRVQVLLAEIELHKLAVKHHKFVVHACRALSLTQIQEVGCNYITMLVPIGLSTSDALVDKEGIKDRAEDFMFESIILRNEERELINL